MENSSSSSSSSSSTNPISQGCGSNNTTSPSGAPGPQHISVHVNPTTGGDFHLNVEPDTSVENLKKLVSKRLKVPRDRICLLFRDKQLQDGSLVQHGISDGSRITLLPNVETGLITQRPEIGIMQALESLNDTQVNEFLCGKAPLNLSMRLGDHMMLIQLQLSTVSGAKPPTSHGPPPPSTPPSLLQASRNLQHTLRRLSADVFSGRDNRDLADGRKCVSGRRESVYSGTFSGALNPALQDPKGRPRRDVATIVHILNDLLCSVPELRRVTTNSSNSNRRSSPVANEEEPPPLSLDGTNVGVAGASTSSMAPVPVTQPALLPCRDDQNLRTRGKLEHLRLVMGERRERRRQRKQKPYSLPAQADVATDTTVTA